MTSKPKRTQKIDAARRAEIGKEKRARTRKQILQAAFTLLGDARGLAVSIDQVCKQSGLARGTFYSYFTKMDEVFEALSIELNDDFNRAVREAANAMASYAEKTDAAVRYYLERAVRDPKWGWAMVNISTAGPIFGADTYHRAELTAEAGSAAGEFELAGPNSGRDLVLGTTLAAMITQLRHSPSPNYPRSISRHILRGMGVPKKKVEQIILRPLDENIIRAGTLSMMDRPAT